MENFNFHNFQKGFLIKAFPDSVKIQYETLGWKGAYFRLIRLREWVIQKTILALNLYPWLFVAVEFIRILSDSA